MTRLDELSPADQRLVRAGAAQPAKSHIVQTAARGGRSRWRCRCGERFDAWEPAQRHSNDTGHARLEMEWDLS